MITKINMIKNMGIFRDYPRDIGYPQPKEFKKCNVIYGLNGAGKTTLSKLFNALGGEELEDYPQLDYEILVGDESFKKRAEFPTNIKVFNKDYIKHNIFFESGKTRPIFLLGEENIQNHNMLVNAEKKKEKIKGVIEKIDKIFNETGKDNDNLYRRAASTIKADINLPATRQYDKRKAENNMEDIKNKGKIFLDGEALEENRRILREEDKNSQKNLNIENKIEFIMGTAAKLCKKTVESEAIGRLTENAGILSWVEKGLVIHEISHEKEISETQCEFCLNTLSVERIKNLLKHFNQADKELKKKIDEFISDIKAWKEQIKNLEIKPAELLYSKLREEYSANIASFEQCKNTFFQELEKLIREIENKKQKTDQRIELNMNINSQAFFESLKNVNLIIDKHNNMYDNISKARENASNLIINYHLSEIYDDVQKNDRKIEIYNNRLQQIKSLLPPVEGEIREYKEQNSEFGKACSEMNENMALFFGRQEIKLSIFEDEDGEKYIIERGGKIAENLSEGEKTAIAFIHFLVSLEDSSSNDIIVVDDPVSSLDNNFLFNAFSFLITKIKKMEQLFVLTHNFEFLKMFLTSYNENDDEEKKRFYYFMIKNKVIDGARHAFIDDLDKMLRKFTTEYQYLFQELHKFHRTENPTCEEAYQIPNMVRKFLEIFGEFQVPKASYSFANKLYKFAEEEIVTKEEIEEIIKFLNTNSHAKGNGLDPNLAFVSKKIVNIIFKIVEKDNPRNFNRTIKLINS